MATRIVAGARGHWPGLVGFPGDCRGVWCRAGALRPADGRDASSGGALPVTVGVGWAVDVGLASGDDVERAVSLGLGVADVLGDSDVSGSGVLCPEALGVVVGEGD